MVRLQNILVNYAVIARTNEHRVSQGLQPLDIDPMLMESAQRWAKYMASNQAFHHSAYQGENIAWGQVDADEAVRWWLNSPGHEAQILAGHTVIGVGVAISDTGTKVWVQHFAAQPLQQVPEIRPTSYTYREPNPRRRRRR